MPLNDETTYETAPHGDLVCYLMAAQAFAKFFMFHAMDALKDHGVDFRTLPEWLDQTRLDAARKLKPHAAQPVIIDYFDRLEAGLHAAVRRKQMRVVR